MRREFLGLIFSYFPGLTGSEARCYWSCQLFLGQRALFLVGRMANMPFNGGFCIAVWEHNSLMRFVPSGLLVSDL
jgi:hypothetical protein